MKEYIAWFSQGRHGESTMPMQELVRCKDCIRWRQSKSNTAAKVCDWDWYEKTESDYCSWAKRREDG